MGVFEDNQIEPATAAFSTSGDAPLSTNGLKVLTNFLQNELIFVRKCRAWSQGIMTYIKLLCDEWASTHSGSVCFYDTNDALETEWRKG